VIVEAPELAFPELPVLLEPLVDLPERRGDERARAALGVASARDEAGALEHLEVFGDRGLAQVERCHQLRDARLAGRELRQDRAARRMGQRREGEAETVALFIHNHMAILPDGNTGAHDKSSSGS
jgi:hypothetical protein